MATGPEIRAAREALGQSQADVAKAVGMSQPAYLKIEDGTTRRSHFMSDIERHLGLAEKLPLVVHRPEPDFFGPRDLKVFSAAEGGPGQMIISSQPIDIVVRPWYLEHVPEGYAVLITGESMWPAYRPGDYAIVNPRLPLMRDEEMIFRAVRQDDGEQRASIKLLQRWTTTDWLVEQYNPPEGQPAEYRLSRAEWPEAVRVVGRYRR